jgi:hypothetical protein
MSLSFDISPVPRIGAHRRAPLHAEGKMKVPSIGLLLFALLTSACAHVAAYDRGALANPTMTASLEGAAAGHVHAVHEGAVGGGSVAESGCGCN